MKPKAKPAGWIPLSRSLRDYMMEPSILELWAKNRVRRQIASMKKMKKPKLQFPASYCIHEIVAAPKYGFNRPTYRNDNDMMYYDLNPDVSLHTIQLAQDQFLAEENFRNRSRRLYKVATQKALNQRMTRHQQGTLMSRRGIHTY